MTTMNRTSRRSAFNLQAEIQKAWDWCWKYYCEPSVYENENYNEATEQWEKTGEKRTLEPRQSWLTATDLERRVRAAAAEQLAGAEYGSKGADAWGSNIRISTGGAGSLLDACRDWLQNQALNGKLSAHNFGRGHISGMRFRPVGLDLTEAEKKTLAKRNQPYESKPVHFADPKTSYPAKSLCSRAARLTNRAKGGYHMGRSSRSSTRTTREEAKVTCPRCLKLLQEAATAPSAS